MYSKLFQSLPTEHFGLPYYGIKYSEKENTRNLYERQLLLEQSSQDQAVNKFFQVYESLSNFGLNVNMGFAKQHIVQWFPNLCKVIREEQQQCRLGTLKGERKYYAQFLAQIEAEKLAVISLTELMKCILKLSEKEKKERLDQKDRVIVSKLLFAQIGKSVNVQYIFQQEEALKKEKEKKDLDELVQQMKTENQNQLLNNIYTNKSNKIQINYEQLGIPKETQYKIGSLLVYVMKECIKIRNEDNFWVSLLVPSYIKSKRNQGFVGVINVNQYFLHSMNQETDKTDSLFMHLDRSLPMIYPPAKWQDYEMGGYYLRPTHLMRFEDSQLQEKSLFNTDLSKVYEILNIIGKTPWRINKRVLNVMEKIWEEGGDIGEIPKKYYDYTNYIHQYQVDECKDYKEKAKLMRKIQQQRDIHSNRSDFLLKLKVARAFQNLDRIYFPHNVDFRGRLYPIPPHLNHIGADRCRGLLEFSESKRIGKTGWYWLKVHTSNLLGVDKLSFDQRVAYTESQFENIKRWASDPIKNREWLQVEDCWQALSAIFEVSEALQLENPEDHISHLHVHMDGSCNGLQHYAAIGRDKYGAEQVNLRDSIKPGDLYSHVASMVEQKIDEDCKNELSENYEIAKKLQGQIKRKIVKQTVMTSVYGVTFVGARQQILRQLKDRDFMNEEDNYKASYYLATVTLLQIKNLFTQAHYIKKWLISCAALISATGNPVSWITDMGLPVVQPYRNQSTLNVINTVIQKITIEANHDELPINKQKQRSAFPPNYIHSLDSTHLMYTAIECNKLGIYFAAVHDSYWTHAADVEILHDVLRKQFVKLHSQPLLEDLRNSFQRRFPTIDFPEIPKRGELNLEDVIKNILKLKLKLMIRRIFWNFKTAFVGLPMVFLAPKNILFYPIAVGVPLYTFICGQDVLHKFQYYDEWDGDVRE
ncbi:hypothetical protein IMG5_034000 [Ichthyophthirius multifiliis]|uniref:DNA-directed RNA polymerase n=1 Tax=Ichthyophthirius multifiliis TaxID=5932 RepID=G0QLN6_ICHMU|nr:hypothetical protein IMG5_034000 [Ichthyophthirius multifiliis]EGR33869.1 hypothetical protein IMG5_034000 [Ichthyophthirius multifiliis]|eukprot:XP_004039093.1 hypothetical protein IMG5_034000 [Ichthyophthirius multifiliis]